LEKELVFANYNNLRVNGYTVIDWAENIRDRRSTSSYFMFVGKNLVTGKSKKEKRWWHYQVLK
jgi:hypothetical protein